VIPLQHGCLLPPPPGAKTCKGCGDAKPRSEFFPSSFTLDGLTDRCRPCIFAAAARDRDQREQRTGNHAAVGRVLPAIPVAASRGIA
jgi:hypothetical protein